MFFRLTTRASHRTGPVCCIACNPTYYKILDGDWFALFRTVFKAYEKCYRGFLSKGVKKKTSFQFRICFRRGSLVIGPRVVQFRE